MVSEHILFSFQVTTSKGKMSVRNTTTVHGGCNTNSNSGGSPTQRLSREDLILDGRTVCTDYPKVSVYDPPADDNESQRSIQVSQASMKPLQAQSWLPWICMHYERISLFLSSRPQIAL